MERDKTLNVRLLAEELEKVRELAEDSGISVSDWIRLAIRTSHNDRFELPRRAKRSA